VTAATPFGAEHRRKTQRFCAKLSGCHNAVTRLSDRRARARPPAKEIVAMRAAIVSLLVSTGFAAASIAAEAPSLADGQQLYAANCQACHGATATSGVGGDIRGLPLSVLARAVRGIEEMPAVDLNRAELTSIMAYLESLRGG
jgi:mono/diheme cytochrome c family protein